MKHPKPRSDRIGGDGPAAHRASFADGQNFSERWPGLFQCDRCTFITTDIETYDARRARDLYGHDYFHGEEYHDYSPRRQITQRKFRLRMRTLDRFLKPGRHRRLLEIGSAYGFFLELVQDAIREVVGVDVAGDAVTYAREHGLDVRLGDLPNMTIGGSFDVVCMWDTIEHLAASWRTPREDPTT